MPRNKTEKRPRKTQIVLGSIGSIEESPDPNYLRIDTYVMYQDFDADRVKRMHQFLGDWLKRKGHAT